MLIQLIIIQIITFVVIIFVLKKLLYSETAKEAERLRLLKDEFSRKEKELQVKVDAASRDAGDRTSQAEKDARKYLEEKEKEARQMKDALLTKAREQADEMVKAAVNSKEKLKEEIRLELKDMIPAAAARIFKEVLPSAAREIMHDELVGDVLGKIKKMEKDTFKTKADKGEVLTAILLKKSEKDKLASVISEKAGKAVSFSEKEDPKLIAGVIIKLGALVIDGSLENKLRQMDERLG